jgi:hypothetical protein
MKIFLSALENGSTCYDTGKPLAHYFVECGIPMKWNLMSYYYVKGNPELAEYIRDHSELVMIDSGAHSFQKGKKVDWVEYTKQYAEFIRKYDRPNVVGYFEMDVDGVIGYEKVLQLRKILESASDKIIPVWHDSRGIDEFKKMCRDYAGKVIAFSGIRGEIKDHQYLMFLKYAKKYNCKVHCLGMTRKKILDVVPFDYTDSSSWKQSGIYGRIDGKGKVTRDFSKVKREVVFKQNYLQGMEMQKHYHQKWRGVCKD